MESGKFEQEIRYRRWGGEYRWFLTRSAPLRDADGRILTYYGINTDIHDLVMAREQEREQTNQMKAGLAHAEIHLFAIDQEGTTTLSEGDTSWTMQARKSRKSSGLSDGPDCTEEDLRRCRKCRPGRGTPEVAEFV